MFELWIIIVIEAVEADDFGFWVFLAETVGKVATNEAGCTGD